jgi:Holliday junction resolvase
MGDSEHEKSLPILGQGGIYYPPDTVIDSGTSTSGVCYYVVEYFNDIKDNIKVKDDKIEGKIIIKDIFDNETSTKINFQKKELNFLMNNVKNINDIISVNISLQK